MTCLKEKPPCKSTKVVARTRGVRRKEVKIYHVIQIVFSSWWLQRLHTSVMSSAEATTEKGDKVR